MRAYTLRGNIKNEKDSFISILNALLYGANCKGKLLVVAKSVVKWNCSMDHRKMNVYPQIGIFFLWTPKVFHGPPGVYVDAGWEPLL